MLFGFDDPLEVLWFAEGRAATRAEVMASIESGLPTLVSMAKEEGREAEAELVRQTARALQYLPQEIVEYVA